MQRIEMNLETGEVKVLDLTAEEVAIAEAQNQAWLEQEEADKSNKAINLQVQINALQEQLNTLGVSA
jgi:hypothetical protein